MMPQGYIQHYQTLNWFMSTCILWTASLVSLCIMHERNVLNLEHSHAKSLK